MAFRALCFARGEKSALPGFDKDSYVLDLRISEIPQKDLMEDFVAQRISLLSMIKILPPDTLDLIGYASDNPITPRALPWIIPGHFKNHYQIL